MNPNTLKNLKTIGIFLVILALFYSFLLLIDTQFDRVIGDWFENTFTIETGFVHSAHQINWPLFKSTGLILCGVIVQALPPVATMGSRTRTSRSEMSLGSLQ